MRLAQTISRKDLHFEKWVELWALDPKVPIGED